MSESKTKATAGNSGVHLKCTSSISNLGTSGDRVTAILAANYLNEEVDEVGVDISLRTFLLSKKKPGDSIDLLRAQLSDLKEKFVERVQEFQVNPEMFFRYFKDSETNGQYEVINY